MDPRQVCKQKAQVELGHLEAWLDELGARVQKTKTGAETGQQQRLVKLKARHDFARESLVRLNRANKCAWGDLQLEADRAVDDLRSAWSQAESNLKYSG